MLDDDPRSRPPWSLAAALAALSLTVSACSQLRPWQNPPLRPGEEVHYDGRAQLFDRARAPDLLVVASFSGGGSRAAGFAHAVVGELDKLPFAWGGRTTTLAREIDMAIGVSGGSVAAAHLAWHGVGSHLARFDADFLSRDFQGRLIGAALSPVGLRHLSSPWFGRGNLLADELDALLFQGATFGRLGELEARPYLIVGATDLSTGAELDFTSDGLARLCSSIDRVPLAFAVAASSAVPLLVSPLTLQVHRDAACATAAHATLAGNQATTADSARVKLTRAELDALTARGRQFVHLVDGGVSDNLGTRRITDYVAQMGGIGAVLHALRGNQTDADPLPLHIVFLSVSSEQRGDLPINRRGQTPSLGQVASALIYSGLGRTSRETSLVFREAVAGWRQELAALGSAGRNADIFSIEVNLDEVEDAELRRQVLEIPTAFRISPAHLRLVREAARQGIARSSELRRYLSAVGANK